MRTVWPAEAVQHYSPFLLQLHNPIHVNEIRAKPDMT